MLVLVFRVVRVSNTYPNEVTVFKISDSKTFVILSKLCYE